MIWQVWHIILMGDYICTKCRNIGKPKKKKRGSTKTEFFCWMLFPFGLPYTIWRMFSKYNICRYCDEQFLISVNSQSGKRLVELMAENDKDETLPTPSKATESPAPSAEKPHRKPQDPNIW